MVMHLQLYQDWKPASSGASSASLRSFIPSGLGRRGPRRDFRTLLLSDSRRLRGLLLEVDTEISEFRNSHGFNDRAADRGVLAMMVEIVKEGIHAFVD